MKFMTHELPEPPQAIITVRESNRDQQASPSAKNKP